MRTAFFLALLLAGAPSAAEEAPAPPPAPAAPEPAAAPAKGTLTIDISGFRNDTGRAKVALYRTKDDYLKKAEMVGRGKIEANKATVVLEGVEPGTVVISAFHDENDNEKLDTNWIGMPKEGTGVSNNAKGHFGPPKFDDAKFVVAPGANRIAIKLVYL